MVTWRQHLPLVMQAWSRLLPASSLAASPCSDFRQGSARVPPASSSCSGEHCGQSVRLPHLCSRDQHTATTRDQQLELRNGHGIKALVGALVT